MSIEMRENDILSYICDLNILFAVKCVALSWKTLQYFHGIQNGNGIYNLIN